MHNFGVMKLTAAVSVLAATLITACGESPGGNFNPGTNATWLWNGSSWSTLSATDGNSGLNLVYWKDFGGLVGLKGDWSAVRWNGAHWVPDSALPGPPPGSSQSLSSGGSESLSSSSLVLDEANDQLLAIGLDAKTVWGWSNGAWAPVVLPKQWPSGLQMSRLIYDPNRRNVLIFASTTSDPSRAETWTWDGRALKRASPEAIPFAVTELLYVVPDEAGHILALGWNGGFSWDGARWSPVGPACPASRLGQIGMAYDAAHKELIAVGSYEDGSAGTWLWQQGGWKRVATVSAPSGGLSSLVYDPELAGLVLTTFPISGCCWFEC